MIGDPARRGDFPVAERQAPQLLSLQMFPELGVDQIASVTRALAASMRGLLAVAR